MMRTLSTVLLTILMMIAGGCSGPVEPGFRVSRETWHAAIPGSPGSTFWQITNTQDEPLVIRSVTYNGEWEAPLTNHVGGVRLEGGLPVQLSVGESCNFFEYSYAEDPVFMARNRRSLDALRDFADEKEPGTSHQERTEKVRREGNTDAVYRKEVIYLDVETDRGTFRYRPAEWQFERAG